MRGGLAVGDDQHDRLGVGVAAEVPARQQQGVVQVGALLPHPLQRGELADVDGLGVAAEGDELQRVGAEPGAHQVVQRQRGALHRHPAAVLDHRPRRVDAQGDGRAGPLLGLGDLHVDDVQRHRAAAAAEHGVGDGARDVPRLGVAELPRSGAADRLTGRARAVVVAVAARGPHAVHDTAQRGLPQAPQRFRGEPEVAVGASFEQVLVAQLAFELGEPPRVHPCLRTELADQRLDVDVLQPGSGVGLAELLGERVQVGEVGHGLRALAQPQRVVAAEAGGAVPVLPRTQPLQQRVQRGQLLADAGVAERLLRQRRQLGALLVAHRVHHPLRRGGPGGQRVDQLVDVARVLREELAVLGHELVEAARGVLVTGGVPGEQLVEVGQHLLDALHVALVDVRHRLLHALEALVHQLAAEQVLDLLVRLARLGGAPVVVGQVPHGRRGARWQRVQLRLTEPGVVGRLREQRPPLGAQRLREQPLDLLQRAVQPVPPLDVRPLLPQPAHQVVQAAGALGAAAQQLAQRGGGRAALHHLAAELVHGRAQIRGRRQRVGAVHIAAVAVTAHPYTDRSSSLSLPMCLVR